ncbi:hypothetical protein KEM55_001434 [Ascosphaera atra]|nr:hypothetical protein KEM55_001434 [Ascosphaera atra]
MYSSRPLRYQPSRVFYAAAPVPSLGKQTAVAVVFAGYSCVHKLFSDKTLRLSRSKPEDRVQH